MIYEKCEKLCADLTGAVKPGTSIDTILDVFKQRGLEASIVDAEILSYESVYKLRLKDNPIDFIVYFDMGSDCESCYVSVRIVK